MKLTHCHIDGFGCYDNKEFDFAGALSTMVLSNGTGKSTLIDFIYAMLYGLSRTAPKGCLPMRDRYRPFKSSSYGGSLELEADCRRVTICRDFIAKKVLLTVSDGDEIVEQYDSEADGITFGERLLGVDGDTFRRTLLFGALQTTPPAGADKTGTMNAGVEMSAFGFTSDDLNRVLADLKRRCADIRRNDRRGRPGSLDIAMRQRADIKSDIAAASTDNRHDLYRRLNEAKTIADRRRNDIAQLYDLLERRSALTGAVDEASRRFDTAQESELQQLDALFTRHPYEPQRHQYMATRRDSLVLKTQRCAVLCQPDDEGMTLFTRFKGGAPTQNQIDAYVEAASKYHQACEAYAKAESEVIDRRSHRPSLKVWLGVATLCIVIGIIGSIRSWGYLTACAIGVLIAAAGVRDRSNYDKATNALTTLADTKRTLAEALGNNLKGRYGYTGNDYVAMARRLPDLAKRYAEYLSLRQECEIATEEINSYLRDYGIATPTDLAQMSVALNQVASMHDHLVRLQSAKESVARVKGAQQSNEAAIEALLQNLDISADRFCRAVLDAANRQADNEIHDIQQQIDDIDEQRREIAVKQAQVDMLSDKISALTAQHKILTDAGHYLRKAFDAMLKETIAPVRDKYDAYIRPVMPHLADAVTMDCAYNLHLSNVNCSDTDRAKNKDLAEHYISGGERTCLELALRLALVDNMFAGINPPIILDDPFTELDPENHKKVKALLGEVARRGVQIIHYTCHPSRMI